LKTGSEASNKKHSVKPRTTDEIIAEIDRFLEGRKLISFLEPGIPYKKDEDQINEREIEEGEIRGNLEIIQLVKEDITVKPAGEKQPVDSGRDKLVSELDKTSELKDIGRLTSAQDLNELKKKYKGHLIISNPDIIKAGEEKIDTGELDKKKKSSFKRKKTPKVKKGKERKEKRKTKKLDISSKFHFGKSKEFEIVSETETDDMINAVELPEIKPIIQDDESLEGFVPGDIEHVFFDEMDESFEGWSPKITEGEKKGVSLPLSANPEIEQKKLESGDINISNEILQAKSITLNDIGLSKDEWEELDCYQLREPFAYVEVLREKESLDKRYFLVEMNLTAGEERALEFIFGTMGGLTIDAMKLESNGDSSYLTERIEQIIKDYDIRLNDESKIKVLYYLEKMSIGLGKIDLVMRDPNIEDISCDGANVPIFLYHRKYGSLKSNIEFKNEEELSSFIFRLAQKCGKHISIAEPMLDATMPDGSRIQMTLSDEVTAKGSTFTIRKFREDPFSPPDLVEFNTMSSEMVAFMWIAAENGVNTLIAGGTAAGKTTALNALSLFIPREAKIVSIEETREINLPHPNWIPGVARSGFGEIVADKMVGEIDMYDLMKAALRQRPEYIIVGEIRGKEAYVLFQAMATGHATYSTVHADSAQSLIHRLEGKPINIPRVMLQSLDLISLHVITRVKNKRARRCKQIIEIIDIDPTTKEILTNEVFRWEPVDDKFVYSGKSYVLERIRAEKDMSREEMTTELRNRTKIVDWMNTRNIREFREVSKLVAQYVEDSGEVLKKIEEDAL
jgi:type IV secretory pathway ATPase VirB11/archaellum biosynthesis ATPase